MTSGAQKKRRKATGTGSDAPPSTSDAIAGALARRLSGVPWVAALVALVLAMLTLGAARADADSIAYVGGEGNVWVTTPDGERKARVTSDAGTALSGDRTKKYAAPTQADDGTIVVAANDHFFYVLNPDGTNKAGPWSTGTNNGLSTSGLDADIAPGGGLVAYWYLYTPSISSSPRPRVAFFDPAASVPGPCSPYPCEDFYSEPRWIPGQPHVAMINGPSKQLVAQTDSGPQGWLQFAGEDPTYEGFDISRSGWRVLIEAKPNDSATRGELLLWDNGGPPPDPSAGSLVCGLGDFADLAADPRWSPDGQSFTWSDAEGVWVSPAPVDRGDGTCQIAPQLIAPGATNPDWSAATVPGGGDDTGGGGGNTGGGGDTQPPETEITKGPKKKTTKRKAKFELSSSEPGSSFECKLDKKPWRGCASPKKYKKLKPGGHVFKVRATDAAGNTDRSPAKRTWKVKR